MSFPRKNTKRSAADYAAEALYVGALALIEELCPPNRGNMPEGFRGLRV